MFLFLSKSLDFFLAPLSWALLLLLVAAVAFARSRRAGAAFLAASALTLLVFSSQPVANALVRRAEPRTGTFQPGVRYDAVILLGGVVDVEATAAVGRPQYLHGVERMLATLDLLRSGVAREALITGGLLDPDPRLTPEAELLKAQLVSLGIAPERLFVEDQSRNTHENALDSRPIIRAHGWRRLLLVTSAAHMPRAAGCFRAAGIPVDTYPVEYHLALTAPGPGGLFPRAHNLALTTDLLRELGGRWVYRLVGYAR